MALRGRSSSANCTEPDFWLLLPLGTRLFSVAHTLGLGHTPAPLGKEHGLRSRCSLPHDFGFEVGFTYVCVVALLNVNGCQSRYRRCWCAAGLLLLSFGTLSPTSELTIWLRIFLITPS